MPSMETVVTDYSLDGIRSHTKKVCREVANKWTLFFIWGEGGSGEHGEGRALDFMTYQLGGGVRSPGPIRVDLGWEIARYLWANRHRLGVWYVIYRQQIISIHDNSYGPSGRWNGMSDRGSSTANHMDHVHVSFLNDPPAYEAPDTDWFDMADKADLKEVVFDSKSIPNKNEPGGEIKGNLTLAQFCTNVEATQDQHSDRLSALEGKLDKVLELLKSSTTRSAK